MPLRVALLSLVLLLLAPATALASLEDEQSQGRALTAELRSGAKTCGDLSADDFEHIGEYVMGRALGSTSTHQAMNDRMRQFMGDQGEERMHQLMGERYAGCTRAGAAIGPGMMRGSSGEAGWGSMMSSGDWSWMAGSAWRGMTRQDWQRVQRQWMGAGISARGHHGWRSAAIVALVLGVILLTAFGFAALPKLRGGAPPAGAPRA